MIDQQHHIIISEKTLHAYRLTVLSLLLGLCCLLLSPSHSLASNQQKVKTLPAEFVDVQTISPDIQVELRYFSSHNFVGSVIDGYFAERLILSRPAANALALVQDELEPFGLALRVYDAYRPQRAVDHFVRWAEDVQDISTKPEFYPDVPKSMLFDQGYIASRSGHTRGSTVDLTIVQRVIDGAIADDGDMSQPYTPLDMGSPYDFFGEISWPDNSSITGQQRANRMLLKTLMVKHGFRPYAKEWWHFTLNDEPFPGTYFDFPIVAE